MDITNLMVLLVEDEAFTRTLVQRMLKDFGIKRVVAAENGKEAFELMATFATKFDIVLSDLRMPVLDGFELVAKVRAGANGVDPATPIVIMSSLSDAQSVERALGIGVDGYVVKPVSMAALQARMKAALDPVRTAQVAEQRRGAAKAAATA